jgi:hypothetical protein
MHTVKSVFVSTTFYKTFSVPMKPTNYALTVIGMCHLFDRSYSYTFSTKPSIRWKILVHFLRENLMKTLSDVLVVLTVNHPSDRWIQALHNSANAPKR